MSFVEKCIHREKIHYVKVAHTFDEYKNILTGQNSNHLKCMIWYYEIEKHKIKNIDIIIGENLFQLLWNKYQKRSLAKSRMHNMRISIKVSECVSRQCNSRKVEHQYAFNRTKTSQAK